MSENRKPFASILLKTAGKTVKFEAFPSELFPDGPTGTGLYRLRMDGRWLDCKGCKYCYMDMDEIGEMLAAGLQGIVGQPRTEQPALPRGSLVRVPSRKIGDKQYYEKVRTSSDLLRGQDGHHYVLVTLYRWGTRLVRVDDIGIIEVAQ